MDGYQHLKRNFGPVYDAESRILILGSFPSAKSREAAFYYGHPRNRFWPLLGSLLECDVPPDVEGRKALLLEKGIALWDTIEECDIIGSSDSSIRNVVPVDILRILETADIRAIYCNGDTSFRLFMKYLFPLCGRTPVRLPSTSPANAAWTMDRLRGAWQGVREELNENCKRRNTMKVLIAGKKEDDLANYEAALKALDVPCVVSLDVRDAEDCSHLVLPGGADVDPAYFGEENNGSRGIDRELDEAQFNMLRAFYEAGKPVLGICRGCQMINVWFGGSLHQDHEKAEWHKRLVEGTENYHRAKTVPGSLMARLYGGDLTVNSSHHQGCKEIAAPFRVTMMSTDGVVEAIEDLEHAIVGVQWHPERTGFAFLRRDVADGGLIWKWFVEQRGKTGMGAERE